MSIALFFAVFVFGLLVGWLLGLRRARAEFRFEREMLHGMLSARMAGLAHDAFSKMSKQVSEDLQKHTERNE